MSNGYLVLIVCIISIILVIVAVILYENDIINGIITMTIIILALNTMCYLLGTYGIFKSAEVVQNEIDKRRQAAQEQAAAYWNDIDTKAETYKILLDGKEVDKDDIDIHLYSISVNDEKQTIYITNK